MFIASHLNSEVVGIFSGAGIDLSSLVVAEGKICWDLYIDGLVISSDGNILDALGAAIKVYLDFYSGNSSKKQLREVKKNLCCSAF